eukprot:s4213_g1.t1
MQVRHKGEGCAPSSMGSAEAQPEWVTNLILQNGAKLHGLQPAFCGSKPAGHASHGAVVKRSLKRAFRRACRDGLAWYRGRCYTPSDFPFFDQQNMMPNADTTVTPAADLPQRNQRHMDRRRLRLLVWNCSGLAAAKLDEVKYWMRQQGIEASHRQRQVDRQSWWGKLDSYLSGLARRNMLAFVCDFNCSLPSVQSSAGPATFRWQGYQILGAQHADCGSFSRLLRDHRLSALNTWKPELGPTYIKVNQVSRIDYIITRRQTADGVAKDICYANRALFVQDDFEGHQPMVGQLLKCWIPPPWSGTAGGISLQQRQQGRRACNAGTDEWTHFMHVSGEQLAARLFKPDQTESFIPDLHRIAGDCLPFTMEELVRALRAIPATKAVPLEWILANTNLFADDSAFGGVFTSMHELHDTLRFIGIALTVFEKLGMTVNAAKSAALLSIAGTSCRRVRGQITEKQDGKEWLKIDDGGSTCHLIPIVAKTKCLGTIMSYGAPEDDTLTLRTLHFLCYRSGSPAVHQAGPDTGLSPLPVLQMSQSFSGPVPPHRSDEAMRGAVMLQEPDLRHVHAQEWGPRLLDIVARKQWHLLRREQAMCQSLAKYCCLCAKYVGRAQSMNMHLKQEHPTFWPLVTAKSVQLSNLHVTDSPCDFCQGIFLKQHLCNCWSQVAMLLIYGAGLTTGDSLTAVALRCELCTEACPSSTAFDITLSTLCLPIHQGRRPCWPSSDGSLQALGFIPDIDSPDGRFVVSFEWLLL